MKSKSKTNKRYDSADSKKRLLKAALTEFAKEGYDAATTRSIASKARINDSLIQRYFGGKQGLLIALMQEFQERIKLGALGEPQESIEKELVAFFRTKLEISRKHRKFLKIVFSRAIVDPKVRAELSNFSKSFTPELVNRIASLHKAEKTSEKLGPAKVTRVMSLLAGGLSLFSEIVGTMPADEADEIIPVAAKLLARGLED